MFSMTFNNHIDHLTSVFARLTEARLKLKAKKCVFFQHETAFLGHIISKEGVKPDPAKIQAVSKIQRPSSVVELRSFLGLTSYYSKLVKDYAYITKPLNYLTKPTFPWLCTDVYESVFIMLKEKLTTAPIFADTEEDGQEFILDTDASSLANGAVLSQVQDGRERVIAYTSKTLEKPEQNYCVKRKEMLAVVNFTKYCKHSISGRHFILRTDHGSLRWLHV